MFDGIPDGLKVVPGKLVERLRPRQFVLLDARVMNPRLERFGAYVVGDRPYEEHLEQALERRCTFWERLTLFNTKTGDVHGFQTETMQHAL